MPPILKQAFDHEMQAARRLRDRGALDSAFAHLERAHILGQRFTLPHVRVHIAMLVMGWRRRDPREVVGQVVRIVAASLFTRVWVPEGNTGGADVSALRPMDIPDDLAVLLREAGKEAGR